MISLILRIYFVILLLFLLTSPTGGSSGVGICGRGQWPLQLFCDFRQSDSIILMDVSIISPSGEGICELGNKSSSCVSKGESVKLQDISINLYSTDPFFETKLNFKSVKYSKYSPVHCDAWIEDSAILPVPFDRKHYESLGSNYYIIHTDVLLPHFKSFWDPSSNLFTPPSRTVLLPINFQSKFHFDDYFRNNDGYWISSLKALSKQTEVIPISIGNINSLHNFNYYFEYKRHNAGKISDNALHSRVCFRHATFGNPVVDEARIPQKLLKSFTSTMRQNAMDGSGNSENILSRDFQNICNSSVKVIGILSRKNRRRIVNENEILNSVISNVSDAFCVNEEGNFFYFMQIIENNFAYSL